MAGWVRLEVVPGAGVAVDQKAPPIWLRFVSSVAYLWLMYEHLELFQFPLLILGVLLEADQDQEKLDGLG